MIIPCRILLRKKNVSHQSCKKNQNIYFVFNTFANPTSENRAISGKCGQISYSQTGHTC